MKRALIVILATSFASPAIRAGVVINEIFYHSPTDHEDLEYIELFNAEAEAVDLGGWKFSGGIDYAFPDGAKIAPGGYLLLCKSRELLEEFYALEALGAFERSLKNGGETLTLTDGEGRIVDSVTYGDRAPWPTSADGYSASLERICPSAPGDMPENWAASPLSADDTKPGGTPGKRNACYAGVLPPVIELLSGVPDDLAPEQSLSVEAEVTGERVREVNLLHRTVVDGIEGKEAAVPMVRNEVTGRYRAEIPGQKAGVLLRYRIEAKGADGARRLYPAEHDLRPTLSAYVHDKWPSAEIPFGLILRGGADRPETTTTGPERRRDRRRFGRGPAPNFGGFGRRGSAEPRPPRGASAFVHVNRDTGKTTLFDHINIVARNNDRGFKIFFHKDRAFDGMRSLQMVFEGSEWSLLAEALAFDLYRRAGNPAPSTEFVRLWVDGRRVGYHLAVERINTSFLRRNEIATGGNLYKILWWGRDVASQHEKRNRKLEGHEDVLAITERLEKTSGDEQWKVIRESFNVDEVATYFAVNMVLSHWDGFFNNYFAYHDTKNGKWELYPWDQDKTWGYYDGLPDDEVFFDMPVTFGMAGARPPGSSQGGDRGGRFDRRRPRWWRPGGHFSGPLLANPRFRKVFLTRTKEILEKIYTKEIYLPLMESMAGSLEEDVRLRAESTGRPADAGTEELARNVELLKTHLVERRRFLLDQEELRNLEPAPAAHREEKRP